MVGLKRPGRSGLGDRADLNQWLRQEMPVTPELLSLIDLSCSISGAWVANLEKFLFARARSRRHDCVRRTPARRRRRTGGAGPSALRSAGTGHRATGRQRSPLAPSEVIDIADVARWKPASTTTFSNWAPQTNLGLEFSLTPSTRRRSRAAMNWPFDPAATLVIPTSALPPVAEDHSAQPVTQPPISFEDLTSFVGADTVVAPSLVRETEPEALESPPTEDIPARPRYPEPAAPPLSRCRRSPRNLFRLLPTPPLPHPASMTWARLWAPHGRLPFCRRSLGWRNPQRTSTDS